jgi:hypothetical protein
MTRALFQIPKSMVRPWSAFWPGNWIQNFNSLIFNFCFDWPFSDDVPESYPLKQKGCHIK